MSNSRNKKVAFTYKRNLEEKTPTSKSTSYPVPRSIGKFIRDTPILDMDSPLIGSDLFKAQGLESMKQFGMNYYSYKIEEKREVDLPLDRLIGYLKFKYAKENSNRVKDAYKILAKLD